MLLHVFGGRTRLRPSQVPPAFDPFTDALRVPMPIGRQCRDPCPSGESNSEPSDPKSDASASWARGASYEVGVTDRDRTGDNLSHIQALYLLSYGHSRDERNRTSALAVPNRAPFHSATSRQ